MGLAALGILALVLLASGGKKRKPSGGAKKPAGGGGKPSGGGSAEKPADAGAVEAARQVAELEACIVSQSREIEAGTRDAYTCTDEQKKSVRKTDEQKAADLKAKAKAQADEARRLEDEQRARDEAAARKKAEADALAADAKAKAAEARRIEEAQAAEKERRFQDEQALLEANRKKDEAQRAANNAEKARLEAERTQREADRQADLDRRSHEPPGYDERLARARAAALADYLRQQGAGTGAKTSFSVALKSKVATWQKLAGLKSDGLYGRRTRRALAVLGVKNPPPVIFAQGEDEYSSVSAAGGAYVKG